MFGSIWRTGRCVMSRVLLSRSRRRPRLFVCYSSLEETGGGLLILLRIISVDSEVARSPNAGYLPAYETARTK